MRRIALLLAISLGACGGEQVDEEQAQRARLGEACAASIDCEDALVCHGSDAETVCVWSCLDDADCATGTCDGLPDGSGSWCNPDGGEPDEPEEPEPSNNLEEPEPGPREVYPEGPYGTGIGDVMAQEVLEAPDGTPFTTDQVYADEASTLLLIFSTAQWCGRCVADLPDLERFHAEYGDDGLYTMVSVFENLNYGPAVGENAGRHQESHNVSFTTVADPDGALHKYFDHVALPMVLLVDVETMTVLTSDVGWYPNRVEASIREHL